MKVLRAQLVADIGGKYAGATAEVNNTTLDATAAELARAYNLRWSIPVEPALPPDSGDAAKKRIFVLLTPEYRDDASAVIIQHSK